MAALYHLKLYLTVMLFVVTVNRQQIFVAQFVATFIHLIFKAYCLARTTW